MIPWLIGVAVVCLGAAVGFCFALWDFRKTMWRINDREESDG